MPLEEIDYSNGGDTHFEADDKINLAIDKVNQIDANITGGSTGQVLTKSSNSDYDYDWTDTGSSGKADKSQLLMASTSGAGPTSYSTETTMLTLTPSASKSAAIMKYTFSGYLSNDVSDTAIIKLKKNGTLMATSKTTVPVGQINFCFVWIAAYAANDVITATIACTADGGAVDEYILICESLNAV